MNQCFPQINVEMSKNDYIEYSQWEGDLDIYSIVSCIGADCWGVKYNGESIFNTYALYDDIGRTFGIDRINNFEYDMQDMRRKKIYDNEDEFIKNINNNDIIDIYLFGNNPHMFRIIKNNDEFQFKYFISDNTDN